MRYGFQMILAASALLLAGCGGSGLSYSNTPTSNMQFVSCGAYAERGMSVRFKCLVRFMNLSKKDYRLTAVFYSRQNEYPPKEVTLNFTGPLPSTTVTVGDFDRLHAGGIHYVKMNLSTASNPNKIISHFDQSFLFNKIDSKMAESMNLETEVVGEANYRNASGRLPGR